MERLKEDTRAAHDSAEGSRFQSALASGNISIGGYAAYLSQIYLVHKTLESCIRANKSEALSAVVADVQYQEPILDKDLAVLEIDPETIKPLAATQALLDEIEQNAVAKPLALLGYHYVLLGSKHGGKFVAHNLNKRFGFSGAGCRYFDPYGSEFSGHWQEFKRQMNGIACSVDEQEDIVQSARAMFAAIAAICNELDRQGLRQS